ncbi:hypothetical protein EYF80_026201 [Liparis tanakae]|uniref:Uncharacterized protein n=1 Tax=Liparis tanakae TaxID=230148 RepID=A0A4Z2HCJ5_9TELE|nr:hypothetical protein EYF80_026201 [Liparis tanakae]
MEYEREGKNTPTPLPPPSPPPVLRQALRPFCPDVTWPVDALTLRYSLFQRVKRACLQRREGVPESRLRPVAPLPEAKGRLQVFAKSTWAWKCMAVGAKPSHTRGERGRAMKHMSNTSRPLCECLSALESRRQSPAAAGEVSGRTRVKDTPARRWFGPRGSGVAALSEPDKTGPCDPREFPLGDMVMSCSPCRTPSHVWTGPRPRTGTVPSPDSILVRRWLRCFLMRCLLLCTADTTQCSLSLSPPSCQLLLHG